MAQSAITSLVYANVDARVKPGAQPQSMRTSVRARPAPRAHWKFRASLDPVGRQNLAQLARRLGKTVQHLEEERSRGMRSTVEGSSAVAVAGPPGLAEQRDLAQQRAGPTAAFVPSEDSDDRLKRPSWMT